MSARTYSRRNLRFLLHEVLDVSSLCRHDYFAQHHRKSVDLTLEAADRLARDLLAPGFAEMDRQAPVLVDGRVRVHPSVGRVMTEFGAGGWIASSFAEEHDGLQLPLTVGNACRFIFAAANYSASVYPELTAGAAHLILSFGTPSQIETWVPPMLAGRWQGTMALTEPEAGSSLADLATTAEPAADGTYRIRGQKIFISCADHDGVENVVNLMLARTVGAPAGVKGISLFIVPQKRLAADGTLVANDIQVAAIYHKLGYRGAPITELAMGEGGDCHGYLVGQAHRGLRQMFQMMNEARLGVGLGAAAIASAAYGAALDYARQRRQGRPVGAKDPAQPQVPLIEHADVRRMLLFQRAVVEGALGLILYCSLLADRAAVCRDPEKQDSALLLDLLTPVAKSYPAEAGILATSAAIQCFGGYGYCEDFPVEQHFRDIRIHPIHEGTTGIQAMDLLGRKVVMENGRALRLLAAEMRRTMAQARGYATLAGMAEGLEAALAVLERTTGHLVGLALEKGPEVFLADATLYLELFGIVTVAWQWLGQAVVAQAALETAPRRADVDFYTGKIFAARYFMAYEVPRAEALARRLCDGDPLTLEMGAHHFNDQ
jgi:butyryl-CoA dehydrogenase